MKNIDLLFVEDNEDYIDFVGRAVHKINNGLRYHYITDGEVAIDYLEQQSLSNAVAKVILLDIDLPGINGLDLLQKIRKIPQLQYVPVIMFSTSDNPQDIKQSYDYGANAYLVKPVGFSSLTETLKTVCDFWLASNCSYN